MLKQILFLLIFIFTPVYLYANYKTDRFRFNKISTSINLPTKEVRKVYQDKQGYIWISTYNGLLRYDGYTILVYKPDGANHGISIDSFVNVVAEDDNENLWIGTHNGLYVLHKPTNRLLKVPNSIVAETTVEAIVCASNGDLWIGSNKGLFRRKTGSDVFLLEKTLDVKSLLEDNRGHIWIGTWEQGIQRFDPGQKKYYVYNPINKQNSAHIIFQDESNQIWVGTWRYGLAKLINPYDPQHCSVRYFVNDKNNPNSLLDNIIYAIAQDLNSKKIWIGSRSGISILENEQGNGHFTNIVQGDNPQDLPFNEVNALLCSREGLMWVGMLGGGVCTVNTDKSQFDYDSLKCMRKYYPTSSVRSLFQEETGNLWLGIMGFGLVYYDKSQQEIIPYKNYPGLKDMDYTSTVNDIIYRKRTNELCFATWDDGVWFYDKKKHKSRVLNMNTNPKLFDNCIYSLLEDSRGNLWLGTRSGIFVWDTMNKLRSLNELILTDQRLIQQPAIFKIAEDQNGDIWIATNNKGVWRMTPSGSNYAIQKYMPSNQSFSTTGAMTLCVDGYNRVWAGTNGNGLELFDRKNNCFKPVLTDYFTNSDVVFSILEDNQHTLWITTNSEMLHINITEKQEVACVRSFRTIFLIETLVSKERITNFFLVVIRG